MLRKENHVIISKITRLNEILKIYVKYIYSLLFIV